MGNIRPVQCCSKFLDIMGLRLFLVIMELLSVGQLKINFQNNKYNDIKMQNLPIFSSKISK